MTEQLIRRPPILLILGCVLYALIEITSNVLAPSGPSWVRAAITVVLFYFLLRGSRVATILWAICNLLGAVVAGYFSMVFLQKVPLAAYGFIVFGLLALLNTVYLLFNRKLREFNSVPKLVDG